LIVYVSGFSCIQERHNYSELVESFADSAASDAAVQRALGGAAASGEKLAEPLQDAGSLFAIAVMSFMQWLFHNRKLVPLPFSICASVYACVCFALRSEFACIQAVLQIGWFRWMLATCSGPAWHWLLLVQRQPTLLLQVMVLSRQLSTNDFVHLKQVEYMV
jgi:hypothetical protein